MERSTIDFWVGLFVVAGLGALTILALMVGNMGSLTGTEIYAISAQFTDIGGLKPRAAVKSSGVVIGRVAEISFDREKFIAKVTINVEKRYKFPKDTSAAIRTSGLLGEQYIVLEAGGEDAMLQAGDSIKPSLTQSAVVLEKLISQFLYNKAAEGGSGGNSK